AGPAVAVRGRRQTAGGPGRARAGRAGGARGGPAAGGAAGPDPPARVRVVRPRLPPPRGGRGGRPLLRGVPPRRGGARIPAGRRGLPGPVLRGHGLRQPAPVVVVALPRPGSRLALRRRVRAGGRRAPPAAGRPRGDHLLCPVVPGVPVPVVAPGPRSVAGRRTRRRTRPRGTTAFRDVWLPLPAESGH